MWVLLVTIAESLPVSPPADPVPAVVAAHGRYSITPGQIRVKSEPLKLEIAALETALRVLTKRQ
jgi:hypothetical protein